MFVPVKLIYCHFGDFQAIEVVTTASTSFKTRWKSIVVSPEPARVDGSWVWSGELEGKKSGKWPLLIAIIKPQFDNDAWMYSELGVERSQCLRVMGGERSKNRKPNGLVRFVTGSPNEAHLRDISHHPMKEFGSHAVNQLVESFVINEFLHRPGNRVRHPRPRRRYMISNCYFVPAPYVDQSELVEGSIG